MKDDIRSKAEYVLELWDVYIEHTWRLLPCSKLRSLVALAPELAAFVISNTKENDYQTPRK